MPDGRSARRYTSCIFRDVDAEKISGAFDDDVNSFFELNVEDLCDELRSHVSDLEQCIFDYGHDLTDLEEDEEDTRPPPREPAGQKKAVYVTLDVYGRSP